MINLVVLSLMLILAVNNAHSEPMNFLVGIYFMVPKDNQQGVARVKAILEDIQRQAILLGGRPYLYGYHCLTEAQKCSLYGSRYDQLKALRGLLDPENLFNPDVF